MAQTAPLAPVSIPLPALTPCRLALYQERVGDRTVERVALCIATEGETATLRVHIPFPGKDFEIVTNRVWTDDSHWRFPPRV